MCADNRPIGATGGLFVYCQSAFGVGHFVRCLRLIETLLEACPRLQVSLFHGGRPVGFLNLPAEVHAVELEPLVFPDFGGRLSTPTGGNATEVLVRRGR
jgi:predicted glycosyltransferase